MDQGAAGVLVPDIRTREEAERAVAAVKYPPLGTRGVGLARAHGYGPRFDDTFERNNDESLVVLQLEHRDAVAAVDAILAAPGIDATFIGPYDLSASMGLAGQLDHPDVQGAVRRVVAASVRHGIAPGIHLIHPARIPEQLERAVADGMRFIALGSDALVLGDGYRGLADLARDLKGRAAPGR
jgi:2-dehydro-3-deoxyglucarate aldolase